VRARRLHVRRRLSRGAAATVVMSAPMILRWALQRKAPPPQVVAENVQRRLGLEPARYPRPLRHAVWALAHLGFGATVGLAAALWPRRATTGPSAYSFGVAVWAANYAAALPAAGIYPWPREDDRARAAESFLSHLVYAAALRRLSSTR